MYTTSESLKKATVEFDKVMLLSKEGNVEVGSPFSSRCQGGLRSVGFTKEAGDKVLIFKKKRRKGYRRLNGHRQQYTQILVKEIVG